MIDKKQAVEAFLKWFENDTHSTQEDYYKESFNESHFASLNREQLIDFFYHFANEGGKVQSQGWRSANQFKEVISANYESFRANLLSIFSPSFEVDKWLSFTETLKPFGPGLATIILNRADKFKFAIVNNKSVAALNKLGYKIPIGGSLIKQYHAVKNAEEDLLKEFPELQNYFRVDAFTHFLIGTDEGMNLSGVIFEKPYFNLDGFVKYKSSFGDVYDKDSEATKWYLDTRDKLYYLIKILKLRIDDSIELNYEEKPNGRAGRGKPLILKNYVIAGFSPDGLNRKGELFIKLAFHHLNSKSILDIEFDHDKNGKNRPFEANIDELRDNSSKGYLVDDSFPKDWGSLLDTIEDHIRTLIDEYRIINGVKPKVSKPEITMKSLNTILYGPPGSGKTFRIIEIIEQIRGSQGDQKVGMQITDFVRDYSWWEIMAMVLWDIQSGFVPDLQKHPLIVEKYKASTIKSLRSRIWTTLQMHTVEECPNVKYSSRSGELMFFKEKDSTWRLADRVLFEQSHKDLIENLKKVNSISSIDNIFSNYDFITCHQSLSYEDFIEGIKPIPPEDEETSELLYGTRKGLFYLACEKAVQFAGYEDLSACLFDTKSNRKEKFEKAIKDGKEFYFFLDEINRCNIAAVFGELITLIEADKRLGAEHEIADIILPYSQDKFGVPSNLYIIGTMNTADRSVEALDTALRRRFSFVPMYADESKLTSDCEGIDVCEMLTKINNRLSVLKDKDHTIGHAWLWDVKDFKSLSKVFVDKIIPLLQEFFYNDYEKLGLVLGDRFIIPETSVDEKTFANFHDSKVLANQYRNKKTYKIKPYTDWTSTDFISIYKDSEEE